MVEECLFCRMVAGEVPADVVREDDRTLAFTDINPQAPVHILVVPKKHVADLVELGAEENTDAGTAVLGAIRSLAQERGLTDFRTVFNTGAGVGQSVLHVHAHVLAGRPMSWPPG